MSNGTSWLLMRLIICGMFFMAQSGQKIYMIWHMGFLKFFWLLRRYRIPWQIFMDWFPLSIHVFSGQKRFSTVDLWMAVIMRNWNRNFFQCYIAPFDAMSENTWPSAREPVLRSISIWAQKKKSSMMWPMIFCVVIRCILFRMRIVGWLFLLFESCLHLLALLW